MIKKVLIAPSTFCVYDQAPLELLREKGFEIVDNPYKRRLTRVEVVELLSSGITGIIAGLEPLDRDVLGKVSLKVISRCGSGLSNVDLDAAKELGVQVCYTPNGPTIAVAELTIGALLALLRKISLMDADLHAGKWSKETGRQLQGKTVAIVGFGRIGRKVAQLLKGFEVNLIAVDPQLEGNVEGVEIVDLEVALKCADIISLHCSGEQELLSEKEFSLIKKGAFLLNVARGSLVNEQALIKALDNGKIEGAWLDTFSTEPYKGDLIKYPQVLLTPHVGSYAIEGRKTMEMEAVTNLICAFKEIS